MKNVLLSLSIIAIIAVILAIVISAPLITILAVNTVFGTAIPYTFWTWLGTLYLQIIITAPAVK